MFQFMAINKEGGNKLLNSLHVFFFINLVDSLEYEYKCCFIYSWYYCCHPNCNLHQVSFGWLLL